MIKMDNNKVKKKIRKTSFEYFSTPFGAIIVQEVYEPLTQGFGFVVYDRGKNTWQKVEELKNEYSLESLEFEEYLRPYKVKIISKTNLPIVVFPTEPLEFSSTKELMEEIANYIKKYVEIEEKDLWLIVRFVLHSWIYDVGDYAMQIQVLGDFGSGKTRLLKVLRLICYNALMLTGGTSLSAYRRLQSRFQGTLLVNEFEPTKSSEDSNELIQWINSGFERDLTIALTNKLNPNVQEFFIPFSPKIFASRNVVENVATRSRLIVIEMQKKTREDIPIELPKEIYQEAEILRNKLLMFRLKYYIPNYKLPQEILERLQKDKTIDDRFKQNMFPLLILASIIGDEKEADDVFEFYRKASLDFKKQIATQTIEGILFNTVVEICNQNEYDKEEFIGLIDEDYKLVAINTSLLQKKTGLGSRTIVKALERMRMVQEVVKKNVITKFDEDGPIIKTKSIRKWSFPNERLWIEACSRYYFDEVNKLISTIDIPSVLRSSSFIPLSKEQEEKETQKAETSKGLVLDLSTSPLEQNLMVHKSEVKYHCEDCENFIPIAMKCKKYPERVIVSPMAEYPVNCPFFKLKTGEQ
jgi:hypothetical protein